MTLSVAQHDGFQLLLDMCRNGKQQPPFVYTSNIDGHWHRVYDEDKITEVARNISHQTNEKRFVIFTILLMYRFMAQSTFYNAVNWEKTLVRVVNN